MKKYYVLTVRRSCAIDLRKDFHYMSLITRRKFLLNCFYGKMSQEETKKEKTKREGETLKVEREIAKWLTETTVIVIDDKLHLWDTTETEAENIKDIKKYLKTAGNINDLCGIVKCDCMEFKTIGDISLWLKLYNELN